MNLCNNFLINYIMYNLSNHKTADEMIDYNKNTNIFNKKLSYEEVRKIVEEMEQQPEKVNEIIKQKRKSKEQENQKYIHIIDNLFN